MLLCIFMSFTRAAHSKHCGGVTPVLYRRGEVTVTLYDCCGQQLMTLTCLVLCRCGVWSLACCDLSDITFPEYVLFVINSALQ